MKISTETVMHVAKLARLNLTPKEAKKYQKEMSEILKAFAVLKDVKTTKEASFHPVTGEPVLRKDDVEKSLTREEALRNSKHKEKGYFRGPKAV